MRYLLCVLVSFFLVIPSQAIAEEKAEPAKPKNEVRMAQKNEKICRTKFSKVLFDLQVAFSSADNDPMERRMAERKIAAARKTYNETGSFCEAFYALEQYEADKGERQEGEVMLEGEK
ncbi:hypothetical protein CS022_19270 [Veronia nyctiphanis]|uniref:Uncharacterized protein n=1 Tax=Veronia nyctiphanis TaxID=1278244 RepID=A0A4Q0YM41_9GAMM|nr:hypothetical protein [Veronia nyctiphanis]RXJ71897.1 hypothetical protein CS022_19270 [Veronia nyctiphanis]